MSALLVHQFYAALAPWAALSLLLLGRNPYLSRQRIIGSLLLAFFLLRIPVGGWPLFAWCRTLEMNPSFILTGLLAVALWQRLSGRKFFRVQDWSAAWIFGAAAALILYPMGLGLTAIDSYTWGWERFLPLGTALVALLLLIAGNRFGILLLLPLSGFLLPLQESANFWDAVIDPFYGGFALIASSWILLRQFQRA
jgi:hypothetical protein